MALGVSSAALLLVSASARGADTPELRFPANKSETQEVVVEQIYRFQVRHFEPPVGVQPVAKAKAGYATPEDALIAQCSAMLAGDYEWWLTGWDKAGKEAVAKRGGEYWKKNWSDLLGARTFVLLQRAETDGAVIFEYKLDPPPTIQELRQGTMVFRQEDGRWANTRALAEDPVALYWNTPTRRAQVIMRK
jgi:hypothetical protein